MSCKLVALLAEAGVDSSGCVEKEELVQKVVGMMTQSQGDQV